MSVRSLRQVLDRPIVEVMPSVAVQAASGPFIPSPGPAPSTVTPITTPVATTGPYTVASGQTIYGVDLAWLFESNSANFINPLVNNGTIWSEVNSNPSTLNALARFNNVREVTNNGTMVLHSGANATMRTVAFSETGINNTGQIFVLAEASSATFLSSSLSGVFSNSGLIVVQSQTSGATGYALSNGGQVLNGSAGSILVEGQSALAIYFGGAGPIGNETSRIVNDGRIEAHSLDEERASIALYLAHTYGDIDVINRGLIRADVAVAADFNTTVAGPGIERITNEAGGRIEGAFFLDRGDDLITNRGVIVGDVFMEEGNDVVDTRTGTLTGVVDLGWGDDLFQGGATGDRAAGGDGNDRLEGNGGDDLLMGGGNDDVLIGGAGNDGLFGEYGSDRIVTEGADFVWGGAGDDRIEAGDFAWETIDGGEGFDTLVLPTGARDLDLHLLLQQGALADIEVIVLGGTQSLALQAGDAAATTGGDSDLWLTTGAGNRIDLVGAWVAGAGIVVGGVNWRTYTLGAETVRVSGAGTVVAGATSIGHGLDTLTGNLAPLPGEGRLDFTANTVAMSYELHQSVTVNRESTWYSPTGAAVLYSYNPVIVTNYGRILSDRDAASSSHNVAFGIGGGSNNIERVVNWGTVAVHNASSDIGGSTTFGVAIGSFSTVENHGRIEVSAARGSVGGVQTATYSGDANAVVAVTMTAGQAVAVEMSGRGFSNAGIISVFAGERDPFFLPGYGRPLATAAILREGTHTNSGEITAFSNLVTGPTNFGSSAAVWYELNGTASFTNSGLLRGEIALHVRGTSGASALTLNNSGRMEGAVELAAGADVVINTGTIAGAVRLGDGADGFDGRGGTQALGVWGDAGNDLLRGGAGADRLYGGLDDDVLVGGGGNDLLDGGDGYDIAEFSGPMSAYRIYEHDGQWFVKGADGLDRLSNVELLRFADGKTLELNVDVCRPLLAGKAEAVLAEAAPVPAGPPEGLPFEPGLHGPLHILEIVEGPSPLDHGPDWLW